MNPMVAGGCTAIILFTCYQLTSNAMRIFKKFELKQGEAVPLRRLQPCNSATLRSPARDPIVHPACDFTARGL